MSETSKFEHPDLSLIDEARAAGKAYIDSFNGDLDAMLADLNRRTEQAGRTIVKDQDSSGSIERLPSP